MRDLLAELAAVALIGLVTVLAAFFAYRQNPPESAAPRRSAEAVPSAEPLAPVGSLDADLVTRGRALYGEHACSRCHRIGDEGNPRSPLDGIGARRSASGILAWLTADESVRGELSRSVIRTKERFGALPAEELEALVEYLSSLR